MLICRPVGRGNWRVIVVAVNVPPDLFRFRHGQRFTWGEPAQTLRIVEVRP
jgi:hypothetical protein